MKRQLEDNPLLRHQSTMSNLFPKEKKLPLGKLRVNALERTGKMLPKTPLAEHKFLAPPTSGARNWVQIGPTAVPGGQMLSTYYYPNFSRETPTTAIVTGRVTAITVDPSDPKIIYLGAAQGGVWKTIDGGNSWRSIPLPGRASSSPWEDNNIGSQGFYNLNVAVAHTTPDIVYLSGISLWKAVRNTTTDNWSIIDIGKPIHPDNHALILLMIL